MRFYAEGESKAFGGTAVLSGFAPIIFFCHFVFTMQGVDCGEKNEKIFADIVLLSCRVVSHFTFFISGDFSPASSLAFDLCNRVGGCFFYGRNGQIKIGNRTRKIRQTTAYHVGVVFFGGRFVFYHKQNGVLKALLGCGERQFFVCVRLIAVFSAADCISLCNAQRQINFDFAHKKPCGAVLPHGYKSVVRVFYRKRHDFCADGDERK